ncbi:MAG: glycosyltransferase family 4 protein [Acidobacteriota bacterium]
MRLLFVTPELDWPLRTGGQIRRWNTLQALLQCGEVDVVALRSPGRPVSREAYAGCRRTIVASRRWILPTKAQQRAYDSTIGRLRLAVTTARPFEYLGPRNTGLKSWFANLVARERYDVVWIGKPTCANALGWRDRTRTILDGEDYEYVREFHLLNHSAWYGAKAINYLNLAKLYRWERRLPRWYARVIRCSTRDWRRLPADNVVVVRNGTALPQATPPRSPEARVLFVGALGYAPNQMGLEWFVTRVWPAVRQAIPGALLDIVGGTPSRALRDHSGQNGVHIHGFVADLRPFWQRAALSVVPLLAGAGTRLKIPESLAHEVPVVSTRIGAFGLEFSAAEGVWVEDEPAAFAARCCDLLRAPREGLVAARQGKAIVATRYNWQHIQAQIANLAREVAAPADVPHHVNAP